MSVTSAPPRTEAFRTFATNAKTIFFTLMLQVRELDRLIEERNEILAVVEAEGATPSEARIAEILHTQKHSRADFEIRMGGVAAFRLWQVVVLVTCVEAYLQDVLASAATVNPDYMSKSEQQASYADIAAATSLEELASDLRFRWARNWVEDGGPKKWINSLTRMGARGYADDLTERMEQIWGIRHVVVHRAGVADTDFVRRHRGIVRAVGDRVTVSFGDFHRFSAAARSFVEVTDAYFLARHPSLLAPPGPVDPGIDTCSRP